MEWLVQLPIQRTYPIATEQYKIDNERYGVMFAENMFDDKCFSDAMVEAGTEKQAYMKLNTYWISQVVKIIVNR